MSRGYWFATIALGLILIAGLGKAQEEARDEQEQASQQDRPAQTHPVPLPIQIVEDKATAEARERREAEAREREIEDLVAQQGMNSATQAMNEATQRMTKFAEIQTWLVGIGTFLLMLTLYLTRQANRAAQAAVDATWEIGKAQSRCEFSFNPAVVLEWDLGAFNKRMHFNLMNDGATAARHIAISISDLTLLDKNSNFVCEIETVGKQGYFDVCARNAPLSFEFGIVDNHALRKFVGSHEGGGLQLSFDLTATYQDVFEEKWEVHYSLEAVDCYVTRHPSDIYPAETDGRLNVLNIRPTAKSRGVRKLNATNQQHRDTRA